MPTYQYACTECDHRFEAVQAFTDDSLTTCPACGGKLHKVYGSVGVVFKGSGFYRTDSRAAAVAATAAKPHESSSGDGSGKGEAAAKKVDATSGASTSGTAGSGNGTSGTTAKPATSGSTSSTPAKAAAS